MEFLIKTYNGRVNQHNSVSLDKFLSVNILLPREMIIQHGLSIILPESTDDELYKFYLSAYNSRHNKHQT